MTVAVVVSEADEASEHIGEHLRDLRDWTAHEDDSTPAHRGGGTFYRTEGFELRTFAELHLYVEDAAAPFDDPDLLVFASRHSGETGPLLTGHFTGNLGPAKYGGTDGDLATACPNALSALLDSFAEYAPAKYDVGMECTHHGPSEVGVPSLFAELGSAESAWRDPDGARTVARAILDLRDVPAHRERQVVGLGGGHYAPRFARIVRETPWTVGHVAADWAIEDADGVSDDTLDQVFDRSGAEYAVVEDTEAVREADLAARVRERGHQVVGETWVREVGDRPLDVVAHLEDALSTVGEGLRFGERTADRDGDADPAALSVVDLPAELLDAALGVDRDDARAAVAANAVAFETTEAGTRPDGRVALADEADYEALVDALAALLERSYDSVEREEDVVVAHEQAFDPSLAREAGVEAGPAFGRLANGEAVEVDGETVDPAAVTVDRTERFPV